MKLNPSLSNVDSKGRGRAAISLRAVTKQRVASAV
ncbi:hypothetical protein MALU111345_07175 [Marinicrinis lubricantis]